ncbi:MAG: hypothetical protein ABI811_17315 [Acidobacteriota bacterium]
MATWTTGIPTPRRETARRDTEELLHRLRVWAAILVALAFVTWLAVHGFDYYRLDLDQRVESSLHQSLRPSGTIGLRLGMLAVALFMVIFLYPLRKRWRWLGSIGKTKHWLDYHSVIGITAPVLITFHAAFKFGGLAGWAYWIMVAVALSGFVGRYLYTQIPRSLHATELTAGEIEAQNRALSAELEQQQVVSQEHLSALLSMPSAQDVRRMPVLKILWTLLVLDMQRPLLVSRLRRSVLSGSEGVTTLGGLLPSHHRDLEAVIGNARRQARLRSKIAYLDRVRQMFHLWHVIHRPFSVSFAALILVHIGVVLMLGYF